MTLPKAGRGVSLARFDKAKHVRPGPFVAPGGDTIRGDVARTKDGRAVALRLKGKLTEAEWVDARTL